MAGYGRDDSVTGHTYELLYPDTRSLHSGMRISMEQVTKPSQTISEQQNSRIIDGMAFGFSIALLIGSAAGTVYTGTYTTLLRDFFRILTTTL